MDTNKTVKVSFFNGKSKVGKSNITMAIAHFLYKKLSEEEKSNNKILIADFDGTLIRQRQQDEETYSSEFSIDIKRFNNMEEYEKQINEEEYSFIFFDIKTDSSDEESINTSFTIVNEKINFLFCISDIETRKDLQKDIAFTKLIHSKQFSFSPFSQKKCFVIYNLLKESSSENYNKLKNPARAEFQQNIDIITPPLKNSAFIENVNTISLQFPKELLPIFNKIVRIIRNIPEVELIAI